MGALGAWVDLDGAEKLFGEALEIDRRIGRLEGQAKALSNLGLIALTRGDLDGAEKLYRESLEIERRLGRLEGQASDLGNLGLIARTHGDLDDAERLWMESRGLFARIGMEHMVAKVQGWLDGLAQRGQGNDVANH
jgi:tetratricopeptide (TPR) repeat protein